MKKSSCIILALTLTTNFILATGHGKRVSGKVLDDNYKANFIVFEEMCDEYETKFINLSTNLDQFTKYEWGFGLFNDITGIEYKSEDKDPSFKYFIPGTYTVTLKVTWIRQAEPIIIESPITDIIQKVVVIKPCCPDLSISATTGCAGDIIQFTYTMDNPEEVISDKTVFDWDFDDGSPHSSEAEPKHIYANAGNYHVVLKTHVIGGLNKKICTFYLHNTGNTDCSGSGHGEWGECLVINNCGIDDSHPCCKGSFAPTPGVRYLLSAWVKEDIAGVFTYPHPSLSLLFSGNIFLGPFYPKGEMIEGWQRIEADFVVPANSQSIRVDLNNEGDNDVFFDDIRIHPYKSNVKSFVYDPISLRLVAELDENNYASVFEYNEEGELVRVKKETERGMMTIKESRNSNKKKDY